MRRPSRRPGTAVLSALLTLVGTAATVPTADGEPAAAGADTTVDVPRPARGATALRLLGDQLAPAAARNGMSATELDDLLTTDASAWVDVTGAVFFKEAGSTAPVDDPVSAQAPLSETFALHSKPGASRKIFIDFDGGVASATAWQASYPATPTTQPAWDTGGDPAVFDDTERTAIQTIWQTVAEDYAPFDVDVTTEDPGPAGINRSSAADTAYGSHVMVTPSTGAQQAICPDGCGGVAYIDVFDVVNGNGRGAGGDGYGYLQPAWVFPQRLGNSPKNIAEAVSHEVGHNVGLRHDANATQTYDSGHGAWAPIMGSGYGRPISQWSKGDYDGATNQEDDVAIIRSVLGSRADEAPATVVGAPTVPSGTAYVDSRGDVDTFLLGTCSASATVTASPLPSQADLDVQLSIIDSLGRPVATDDPASGQVSASVASGMGASLTRTLGAGTWFASVDGVGNGGWITGYDDYGSLGAYTLTATGCDGALGSVLTTTSLGVSAVGRTVTLAATPTSLIGTPAGEVVFRDAGTIVGAATLGAGSASAVLTSVAPGVHTYSATFVPSGVTHTGSESAQVSVTVADDPPVVVPAAPTPAVAASTTRLKAPRKAEAGSRPMLTVTVRRGPAAAVGTVVVTVGRKARTLTLESGSARLRLPKLGVGKVRIRVRYLGDATTAGSTTKRTIRVTD